MPDEAPRISLSQIDTRGMVKGQLKTFCPLCHASRRHQDDPSLQVNLTSGAYTCWNCKAQGRLVEHRGTPFSGGQHEKKYTKLDEASLVKGTEVRLPEEVLAYFKNRGISERTLIDWSISYGISFPLHDKDNKTLRHDGIPVQLKGIRFPFFEQPGELVYVKHFRPKEWQQPELLNDLAAKGAVGLTPERMIRAVKDGKPIPFGLNKVEDMIAIFEGEIDALSAYEAGVEQVISVPNGAKSLNWLEFDSVVRALERATTIYIAVDNDADGINLREELIRRIGQLVGVERIAVVTWPDGCKDANDVLITEGPEALKKCILEDSEPVPMDGISTADEFMAEYLEYYDFGLPKGIDVGFPGMEPYYRVMPGMLTIITGVTNYGKSEVLDEIIRLMIVNKDWKFAIYSPENYPNSLHMIKLAEKYIGKPYDKEKYGHMTREEAVEAGKWIRDHIFYINPRGTTYTIDQIVERAKILVYRKGIQGLVIDPWNYVQMPPAHGIMPDEINSEVQKIGVFCKATNVHTWVVVHPRTLRRDKEGKIHVPTVHELYGGSKFGDNADFVLAVERDPVKADQTGIHEVTVHCQKARYRYAAKQGNWMVHWDKFSGRFYEVGTIPNRPWIVSEEYDVESSPDEGDAPDDDSQTF